MSEEVPSQITPEIVRADDPRIEQFTIAEVVSSLCSHSPVQIGLVVANADRSRFLRLVMNSQTAERLIETIKGLLSAMFKYRTKAGNETLWTVPQGDTYAAHSIEVGAAHDGSAIILRFTSNHNPPILIMLSENNGIALHKGMPKVLSVLRKVRSQKPN